MAPSCMTRRPTYPPEVKKDSNFRTMKAKTSSRRIVTRGESFVRGYKQTPMDGDIWTWWVTGRSSRLLYTMFARSEAARSVIKDICISCRT